ncbi:replicative helicase loader/inhibitor [Paenibacillus faecis]|nr:replicative helicase loader/inhibitor [Paenibacillus faecis]
MDRTGVILLMKYIAGAYRSFRTVDETQAEEEVAVWHDLLREIPNELAMEKTRQLCQINKHFAPTPAEIYQACVQKQSLLSIYEIQRLENEQQLLELQEYHEREEVKPMPEHIAKRLESLFVNMRVNRDES